MLIIFAVLFGLMWFGLERYYRRNWSRDLFTSLQFSVGQVYAGEEFMLTETIENRKRMAVSVLEIGFHVSRGLEFLDAENVVVSDKNYKRDLFSILGRERIKRSYRVRAKSRGRYLLSAIECKSPSILHLHMYFGGNAYEEEDTEFYVFAPKTDIRELLTTMETMLGTVESSRRVFEDPFAFAGIREYTLQDPQKNINWKASARTGNLMVNTFTSVKSQDVAVYLDVEDSFILRHHELTEEGISVAATLMRALRRTGREGRLYINTDVVPAHAGDTERRAFGLKGTQGVASPCGRCFRVKNDEKSLREMEVYLTRDFDEEKVFSFGKLLEDRIPGENADLLVLISANAGRERETSIPELSPEVKSRCLFVVPYLPSADDREKPEGRIYGIRTVGRQVS